MKYWAVIHVYDGVSQYVVSVHRTEADAKTAQARYERQAIACGDVPKWPVAYRVQAPESVVPDDRPDGKPVALLEPGE